MDTLEAGLTSFVWAGVNTSPDQVPQGLTSDEAHQQLRISSCELIHLLEAGHLRFTKQGNAFLYSSQDVERHRQADAYTPPAKTNFSVIPAGF